MPDTSQTTETNQTYKTKVPKNYQDLLNLLVTQVKEGATTPFEPYTDPRVAQLTADEQAAFQGVRDTQGQFSPLVDLASQLAQTQAASGTGAPTEADLAPYIDPYKQNVIDIAIERAKENYDQQIQGLQASSAMSGAFGGDRDYIMQGLAGQGLNKNIGELTYGGLSDAWTNALSAWERSFGRQSQSIQNLMGVAGQGQGMAYQDLAALENVGRTQRQIGQAGLDTGYEEFQRKIQDPYTKTGWAAQNAYAYPTDLFTKTMTGTSTTTQESSPLNAILGGLATAAGAYFGGPAGAAAGASMFGDTGLGSIGKNTSSFYPAYTMQGLPSWGVMKRGGLVKKRNRYAVGGPVVNTLNDISGSIKGFMPKGTKWAAPSPLGVADTVAGGLNSLIFPGGVQPPGGTIGTILGAVAPFGLASLGGNLLGNNGLLGLIASIFGGEHGRWPIGNTTKSISNRVPTQAFYGGGSPRVIPQTAGRNYLMSTSGLPLNPTWIGSNGNVIDMMGGLTDMQNAPALVKRVGKRGGGLIRFLGGGGVAPFGVQSPSKLMGESWASPTPQQTTMQDAKALQAAQEGLMGQYQTTGNALINDILSQMGNIGWGITNATESIFGRKEDTPVKKKVLAEGGKVQGKQFYDNLSTSPSWFINGGNPDWKTNNTASFRNMNMDEYLNAIMDIESGGDPKARNKDALGLFQFTSPTWKEMIAEHGGEGVRKMNEEDILALREDPEMSRNMARIFTERNNKYLSERLGRNPNPAESYLAHFLGNKGAMQMIRADRNEVGAKLFPAAAKSNPNIFYETGEGKERRARTIGEIKQRLSMPFYQRKPYKKGGVVKKFAEGGGLFPDLFSFLNPTSPMSKYGALADFASSQAPVQSPLFQNAFNQLAPDIGAGMETFGPGIEAGAGFGYSSPSGGGLKMSPGTPNQLNESGQGDQNYGITDWWKGMNNPLVRIGLSLLASPKPTAQAIGEAGLKELEFQMATDEQRQAEQDRALNNEYKRAMITNLDPNVQIQKAAAIAGVKAEAERQKLIPLYNQAYRAWSAENEMSQGNMKEFSEWLKEQNPNLYVLLGEAGYFPLTQSGTINEGSGGLGGMTNPYEP